MTALHYGDETFQLADREDVQELSARIEAKVRERGGWVDIAVVDGDLSLLISTGLSIWFDRR